MAPPRPSRTKLGISRRPARMAGFEPLETREQPAGGLLTDLNATGSAAFSPFPLDWGGTAGGAIGQTLYFTAADGTRNPALFQSDGTAAGTKLVLDLTAPPAGAGYPSPFGPDTRPVLAAGGKVFFTRPDAAAGNEVWVTDGTTAGTKLVKDIAPGKTGSDPTFVAAVNGRAVFQATAYDGTPGTYPARGLFGSDGTTAGTVALTHADAPTPRYRVATGGKVYFTTEAYSAQTFNVTTTIWVTDGTTAGTKKYATLPTGVMAGGYSPDDRWAVAVGGKLYFAASTGGGTELWISDGTDAGTKVLADINPTTNPSWTGGIPPYPHSSFPQQFTVVGSTVYFAADDGVHGQELWKTDGTAAGTVMVKDVSPTVGSSDFELTGTPTGSRLTGLTAFNGKLYFAADDGTTGQQLYVSDGTSGGTVRLTTAARPATAGGSFFLTDAVSPVGPVGGKLLFALTDGANGRQLWATDGTTAGTAIVKKIGAQQTLAEQVWAGPIPVGMAGGKLLFSADDGTNGRQLWSTDGTAGGTAMVARLNPTNVGSDPKSFVTVGTKALFAASDGPGRFAVYATDGTSAPVALARFAAAADATDPLAPGPLTTSGSRAYFVAQDGVVGRELWVTDGTPAGTKKLKTVTPSAAGPTPTQYHSGIDNLTDVGGTMYFTIDLPGTGQELWKTDGTDAGTKRVKQTNVKSSAESQGFVWSTPLFLGPVKQLTAVGDKLYFAADDGTRGEELWVSDGTEAGTKVVKDINPPGTDAFGTAVNAGSMPTDLTAFNGKLYFTTFAAGAGRQLWVSDGTAAGTKQAAAVSAETQYDNRPPQSQYLSVQPRGMVAAGGKLFLSGYDAANGWQLWASDGTQTGTKRLTALGQGFPYQGPYQGANVEGVTAVGAKVYFTATDANGRELYVTDGTAAGTKKVKQIGPAATPDNLYPPGSQPQIVSVVGDKVLFTADDGVAGRELWITDGTAAGTKLARDFAAGRASGLPGGDPTFTPPPTAAVVGGRLVLAVTDPATGSEPWSVPLADLGIAAPPASPATVPPTAPPPPPPVVIPISTPPINGVGPRVVDATFGGPRTGVFDRVTVKFNGPINAATLGKATAVVTGPGGPVGVSAVLPVAGSNGTAFTLMLSGNQTTAGTYTVSVGPGVTDVDGRSMDQNRNGVNGEAADKFTATATLGAPTAPPASPPAVPPTVPPPAATAGVVRVFAPAATELVAWSGNLASVTLPAGPDYKVTVFWGDGRTSVGTLARNTATGSAYTISGGHTYAASGTYAVMVRVTGTGGKTVLSIDATATVAKKRP